MSSKLKYEKKHKRIFFGIGLILVFAFAAISLISMQVQIAQKNSEYNSLQKTLSDVRASNEQLERYCSDEYRIEYIEQIARDSLDYSYSDETVYYFIPK